MIVAGKRSPIVVHHPIADTALTTSNARGSVYDPSESAPRTASSSVAAELGRLSAHYGFSVVDHVVFTRGLISAVVDHIVVDRYGIVIVDAELHVGATILGTDTGTKWTATFLNGQVAEFRNPLYLNAGNENLVKQALADLGVKLEPSEIRSVVVFSGADISRLSLVEVNTLKVKTTESLSEYFDARYTLPPNNGRLTGPDIDRVVSTVAAYAQVVPTEEEVVGPWHADPAVVAAAALVMPASRPPSLSDAAFRMPGELAGHHTAEAEGPSLRAALLTLGTILASILALVAGVVFFPQLQAGSTTAWTATLVVLVALAELAAANIAAARGAAGKTRSSGGIGGGARFLARLALVFLLVAVGWFFIAGGVAERIGATLAAQFEPPTQVGSTPINPGVMVAKRRLKVKAPQVYKTVINLNSPDIHPETEGRISYTWSYTPRGASVPASFTLTIDAQGKVVSP